MAENWNTYGTAIFVRQTRLRLFEQGRSFFFGPPKGRNSGMVTLGHDHSICSQCRRCRRCSAGCDADVLLPDGSSPILYGSELSPEPDARCPMCGCRRGYAHHRGCLAEICPRCGGYLLGCNCWLAIDPGSTPEEELPELETFFHISLSGDDPVRH